MVAASPHEIARTMEASAPAAADGPDTPRVTVVARPVMNDVAAATRSSVDEADIDARSTIVHPGMTVDRPGRSSTPRTTTVHSRWRVAADARWPRSDWAHAAPASRKDAFTMMEMSVISLLLRVAGSPFEPDSLPGAPFAP